eukprot:GILK01004792.1.p1 GENE.GILK01004792.1~~GILK01004792.1.p1  ORF type:complete len:392 (+),score=72.49 GILK01004792.1:67-1176(+)
MSSFDIEKILLQYVGLFQNSGALEAIIPRSFDNESINRICHNPRYGPDAESATNALAVPIWDMLDRGGKRWRPVLCMLIAESLGGKAEDVVDVAALCEIVHNGSLMIDDVEDSSEMRRGKKCSHLIFGTDVAVNASNAMYFLPLKIFAQRKRQLLAQAGSQDVTKGLQTIFELYEEFSQEMINIHFGQGWDIWWHQGHTVPSIEQYLQMVAYKTGTLARLSAKLSCIVVGCTQAQKEAIGRFAETIGVAFQIQDDLLNLEGEEYIATRSHIGEDVFEGKRTIMVIHCYQNSSPQKASRLIEILNAKTHEEVLIREAIDLMRETNSLNYAREQARQLIEHAWEEVDALLPESEAKGKLRAFSEYLVNRSK